MALLETWDTGGVGGMGGRGGGMGGGGISMGDGRMLLGYHDADLLLDHVNDDDEVDASEPMFDILRHPYQPPDKIKHIAVASRMIVVALENLLVIRIWPAEVDERTGAEIQTAREEEISDIQRSTPQAKIHKVFLDPYARHVIISLTNGDNWYLGRDQLRPRILSPKFKGIVIDSIAWDTSSADVGNTGNILVGTTKGRVREANITRKADNAKGVYTMPDEEPVTGLHYEKFPSDPNRDVKYVVFATTPTRFYQFIGGPSFEQVFPPLDVTPAFNMLPGDLGYSALCLYSKYSDGLPQTISWLTSQGVYYGDLIFAGQNQNDSLVPSGQLLNYPAFGTPDNADVNARDLPLDLSVTEFHFLLLYRDKLVSISRLNEQVTSTVPLMTMARKVGKIVGIASDPISHQVWIAAQGCLFRVAVCDESRDVWRLYLAKNQFEDAAKYCRTERQRDLVDTTQADYHFANGKFRLAAEFYGRTNKSFEEVALMFVRKNEMSALRTYLTHKLETIPPKQTTQRILICTWLTQLYLNALHDAEGNKERRNVMHEELSHFLSVHKDSLDQKTTVELLASHGLTDLILLYADLVREHHLVLTHLTQNYVPGMMPIDRYRLAVTVMMNVYRDFDQKNEAMKAKFQNLVYNFSPRLIEFVPVELVDAWVKLVILSPRRLLPALSRYRITCNPPENKVNQAIRYLEFCVNDLRSQDKAIHNYLISLYVQERDDAPLIRYLQKPNRRFDLQYALRQCLLAGKTRACVFIYGQMGLYEESVELALTFDVELATANANAVEDDEALSKRLWLRIARHVVEKQNDIKKAVKFLHQTDLVKIEDVLPFFKDFTVIDEFKDEIKSALVDYNKKIDILKEEMKASEASAEFIRKDIRNLRQKYGFVSDTHGCDICGHALISRPFYFFPCEHSFHVDCFTNSIYPHLDRVTAQQVQRLQARIKEETWNQSERQKQQERSRAEQETTFSSMVSKVLELDSEMHIPISDDQTTVSQEVPIVEQLQEELDRSIASECMYCGDVMIKAVELPFLDERELMAEAQSWAL